MEIILVTFIQRTPTSDFILEHVPFILVSFCRNLDDLTKRFCRASFARLTHEVTENITKERTSEREIFAFMIRNV